MAYIVNDPKGIRYSDEGGVFTIENGDTLTDKMLEKGLFREEWIANAVKEGRLKAAKGKQADPIAPSNMKMSELEKKTESKSKKTKGK